MAAYTFTLDTSADTFGRWLEGWVQDSLSLGRFQTERGTVIVNRLVTRHPTRRGFRAEMGGDWISDAGAVQCLGPLVEFDVVQAAAERCQVRAHTTGVVAGDTDLLREFLGALAEVWPERIPTASYASDSEAPEQISVTLDSANAPSCGRRCSLRTYTRERLQADYREYYKDWDFSNGAPTQARFAQEKLKLTERTLQNHRKHIGAPWPPF